VTINDKLVPGGYESFKTEFGSANSIRKTYKFGTEDSEENPERVLAKTQLLNPDTMFLEKLANIQSIDWVEFDRKAWEVTKARPFDTGPRCGLEELQPEELEEIREKNRHTLHEISVPRSSSPAPRPEEEAPCPKEASAVVMEPPSTKWKKFYSPKYKRAYYHDAASNVSVWVLPQGAATSKESPEGSPVGLRSPGPSNTHILPAARSQRPASAMMQKELSRRLSQSVRSRPRTSCGRRYSSELEDTRKAAEPAIGDIAHNVHPVKNGKRFSYNTTFEDKTIRTPRTYGNVIPVTEGQKRENAHLGPGTYDLGKKRTSDMVRDKQARATWWKHASNRNAQELKDAAICKRICDTPAANALEVPSSSSSEKHSGLDRWNRETMYNNKGKAWITERGLLR